MFYRRAGSVSRSVYMEAQYKGPIHNSTDNTFEVDHYAICRNPLGVTGGLASLDSSCMNFGELHAGRSCPPELNPSALKGFHGDP